MMVIIANVDKNSSMISKNAAFVFCNPKKRKLHIPLKNKFRANKNATILFCLSCALVRERYMLRASSKYTTVQTIENT